MISYGDLKKRLTRKALDKLIEIIKLYHKEINVEYKEPNPDTKLYSLFGFMTAVREYQSTYPGLVARYFENFDVEKFNKDVEDGKFGSCPSYLDEKLDKLIENVTNLRCLYYQN